MVIFVFCFHDQYSLQVQEGSAVAESLKHYYYKPPRLETRKLEISSLSDWFHDHGFTDFSLL